MPFVFLAGEVLPALFQWSQDEEKMRMTKRKYEEHTLVAAQSLGAKKKNFWGPNASVMFCASLYLTCVEKPMFSELKLICLHGEFQ